VVDAIQRGRWDLHLMADTLRGCCCDTFYSLDNCLTDVVIWTMTDLSSKVGDVVLWLEECWTISAGTPPDDEPLPDIPIEDLVDVADCDDPLCPTIPPDPCFSLCGQCLRHPIISFASISASIDCPGCSGVKTASGWSTGQSGSIVVIDEGVNAYPVCTRHTATFAWEIVESGDNCVGSVSWREDQSGDLGGGNCASFSGCYFATQSTNLIPVTASQCRLFFSGDHPVQNDPIGRTFEANNPDVCPGGELSDASVTILLYGAGGCCTDGEGDCVPNAASTGCGDCP
jgi:hypothetical protein